MNQRFIVKVQISLTTSEPVRQVLVYDGAVLLRRELERATQRFPGDTTAQYAESQWTPDTITDLLEGIGDLQDRFLRILHDNPNVVSQSLVVGLNIESDVALAGVLSGLSKQLKKMSISPRDLYRVDVRWKGKTKERYFDLAPDFRVIANELGWPEAWKQKPK
jgi:hypothetical protein